ncbi:hypothetical protein PP175_02040 [Aneurinibacillus sp. Ricciae_BoGa-3]|uniref:hypothetical protein n=1 Tax=Aneurinibacillus sp. Ricciae_BoGa-3 TaxID=3022697 RepID=UPI0023410C09|nr:hypothetical protein [Aneurinibacillus sp. Ricciae_BoGa-3]WCK54823.1 hypothetical protein PP175_02040 [Aneurinibacillus sp. Ricciae_BoGa-3]
MKKHSLLIASVFAGSLLLAACGSKAEVLSAKASHDKPAVTETSKSLASIKDKGNQVTVDLVAKATEQELAKGVTMPVWTYGGTVPSRKFG